MTTPAPQGMTNRQLLERRRHMQGVEALVLAYLQRCPHHVDTPSGIIAVVIDDTSLDEMIYDGEVSEAIFSLASRGDLVIARDRRVHLSPRYTQRLKNAGR